VGRGGDLSSAESCLEELEEAMQVLSSRLGVLSKEDTA
jgi:hypothetical protein